VILEVSENRMPCWKLGRKWGLKSLPLEAQKKGFLGWYMRVLQEGYVDAGNVVELISRPYPGFTINFLNELAFSYHKMPLAQKSKAIEDFLSISSLGPGPRKLLDKIRLGIKEKEENRLYGKS
jgi:MOSC domain-containing protein YiiM